MQLNFEEIYPYCEKHSTSQGKLLDDLERETHIVCFQPHMLSGHLQGRFLSFVSKIIQPKVILEIGTYTGFSALCLAEGLAQNGILHTIEIDEEKESIITKYFLQSAYASQLQLHIGNALEIIPTLNIAPDLIFIDADKVNYSNYYQLSKEILGPKGTILIDNTLFHGDVLLEKKNKNAAAVHQLNEMIALDQEVEQVLLPLRDGITMIRKIN